MSIANDLIPGTQKGVQRHQHYYPLVWLLIMSFAVFALLVVWDLGVLRAVASLDRSYVTSIIFGLFILSTCHAAWHIFKYSAQIESLLASTEFNDSRSNNGSSIDGITSEQSQIRSREVQNPNTDNPQIQNLKAHKPRINTPQGSHTERDESSTTNMSTNNTSVSNLNPTENQAQLDAAIEMAAEKFRSPVDLGWFLVDLAIRLGLVGTIIGFILIFTSLSSVSIEGAEGLKELMVAMSGGMGTALFTTLGGLIAGTVMSFQYLILGRQTEYLIGALVSASTQRTD